MRTALDMHRDFGGNVQFRHGSNTVAAQDKVGEVLAFVETLRIAVRIFSLMRVLRSKLSGPIS
jgi:hypothetical protein